VDRRAAAKQISPGALALGRHEKRLALKEATDAWVCGQTPQGRLRRTLCLGLKRQWIGRPFQGASLDGTSPRAKAPDFAKPSLRRGWLFGVTYHNMRGAIASATAAWAILSDRPAVIGKCPKKLQRLMRRFSKRQDPASIVIDRGKGG